MSKKRAFDKFDRTNCQAKIVKIKNVRAKHLQTLKYCSQTFINKGSILRQLLSGNNKLIKKIIKYFNN
tara:strand:- start:27 stop:230 length:204 start_codon:yes stop_codon:yes gene_type:complete